MQKKIIQATLAAILAAGAGTNTIADANTTIAKTPKMMKGLEKCYGIAKAGMNDCSYANQSCAGSSKIDGEKTAWITVPKGTCNKIIGGNTQPPKK